MDNFVYMYTVIWVLFCYQKKKQKQKPNLMISTCYCLWSKGSGVDQLEWVLKVKFIWMDLDTLLCVYNTLSFISLKKNNKIET